MIANLENLIHYYLYNAFNNANCVKAALHQAIFLSMLLMSSADPAPLFRGVTSSTDNFSRETG